METESRVSMAYSFYSANTCVSVATVVHTQSKNLYTNSLGVFHTKYEYLRRIFLNFPLFLEVERNNLTILNNFNNVKFEHYLILNSYFLGIESKF